MEWWDRNKVVKRKEKPPVSGAVSEEGFGAGLAREESSGAASDDCGGRVKLPTQLRVDDGESSEIPTEHTAEPVFSDMAVDGFDGGDSLLFVHGGLQVAELSDREAGAGVGGADEGGFPLGSSLFLFGLAFGVGTKGFKFSQQGRIGEAVQVAPVGFIAPDGAG